MTDHDTYDLAYGPRRPMVRRGRFVTVPEWQRQTWQERRCKEVLHEAWRRRHRRWLSRQEWMREEGIEQPSQQQETAW